MNINKILKTVQDLKNKFSCAKCKESTNNFLKIKLCGHIYCKKCISSMNTCSKCGIKYTSDDIFNDITLLNVFQCIDNLSTDLQKDDVLKKNQVNSSCIVTTSEENETKQIIDNCPEDKLLDFNCDCSNYVEFKDKRNVIDKKNAVGETKLHLACKKSNEKEVEALLSAGACVNAQDFAQWTPLHEAIIKGNKQIVEWLVEKGSIVNAPGDNYITPLHKAIVQKNVEIAEILIKNGANLYSKNYEGISPWDLADSDMRFTLNNIKCGPVQLYVPIKTQLFNIYVIGELTDEIKLNIAKLKNNLTVNLANDLNENVTHVVVVTSSKVIKPTFEFFLSILYCIPVVTSEWLQACISFQTIVNCKEYFIIGTEKFTSDVIQCSQINKYKLNPKLFSGCNIFLGKSTSFFYADTTYSDIQLRRLITAGDGHLLKREPLPGAIDRVCQPWYASNSIQYTTHYILYDPATQPELRYNMKELKHVPYQWVFESILKYKLIPPDKLCD